MPARVGGASMCSCVFVQYGYDIQGARYYFTATLGIISVKFISECSVKVMLFHCDTRQYIRKNYSRVLKVI